MASAMPDRPPAWEVHLSIEAREWLIACTTDQAALARVKDPTGAYRMFFRFGRIGNRRIAAVGHGRKKNREAFPRSVIDLAQRKVDAFLADLGVDGFVDPD